MQKRIFALTLAVLTVFCFCACGGETVAPETTEAPTVAATIDGEEKDSLKILTLGHSLTVDSCHMLALIAAAEGVENLTVGTLYYSGTPLNKHVTFMHSDAPVYALYMSSTETPDQPPERMSDVTMKQALRHRDWDIIIMQGGTFELAKEDTFKVGYIQQIQEYVMENVLDQDIMFAWHMPWAFATEPELQNSYTAGGNPYISGYAPYGNNRLNLYNAFAENVKNYIIPNETFKFLIPTGTAIENAMSSYMTEFDLLRDYAHASDYGRVIAAYTWYCKLAGVEELTELKFTTIPRNFFKSKTEPVDYQLTEMEQKIIIESVNNALKNPLQQTQSQYVTAP